MKCILVVRFEEIDGSLKQKKDWASFSVCSSLQARLQRRRSK